MPIIRKRQIEAMQQMNGEELAAYLESLPISESQIEKLFGFIEDELDKTPCDHTLKNSMRFMMRNMLPFPKVTAWLNDNGGYCDCKVLENIETEWRKVFG
jgi:hypothetical protein